MTDQGTKPNPADFSVNEKEGEFNIMFTVTGTVRTTIQAADLAEARQKAREMADADDFDLDLDEADSVDVSHVYKSARMFRVTREGGKVQTSHLQPGDLPREPDERGF